MATTTMGEMTREARRARTTKSRSRKMPHLYAVVALLSFLVGLFVYKLLTRPTMYEAGLPRVRAPSAQQQPNGQHESADRTP